MEHLKADKQALAAFLRERLAKKNIEIAPDLMTRIVQEIDLVERPPDESKEIRNIRNKVDTAGDVTSSSFKLYNIAKIPIYDLIGLWGKEMGILLFEDTAAKIIYAIAMLIHEFYPKLTVEFDEQEAKILYCLGVLGKKKNETFIIKEIDNAYMLLFEGKLSNKQIMASLDVLIDYQVVKRLSKTDYKLVESIKNINREE